MGLFNNLVSMFTGSKAPLPTPEPFKAQPRPNGEVIVTSVGPASPTVEVTDVEVAERASAYAFVLASDPPCLDCADEWWNDETHKRHRHEGSEKAHAWLLPFVPLEIAKLPQLQAAQELGPHGAGTIAKELRVLVREHRKAKECCDDVLRALYAACIASDLAKSVTFEGVQSHYMPRFVDINELRQVKLDYATMGYKGIESLNKTDIKWLVETFGEPTAHQSSDAFWADVRCNAIARYCWIELRTKNNSRQSYSRPQQSMKDWLDELVRRNIGYHKEWQERVAARQLNLAKLGKVLDTAWSATRQPFVVADLETTGLSAETDEVLEFAAIRVAPDGAVTGEFAALVRVARVPPEITRLTGITQELVDREGQPLHAAMMAFAEFIGVCPLFFHNAPFDQRFLKKADEQTKVQLANPVHDTLSLARQAWPSLETYKLAALAEHIGAPAPTHRGLSDARATLAVLLSARKKVEAKRQTA